MTYATPTDVSTDSQFLNLENFNSKLKISSVQDKPQNEYELDDYSDLERRYASVESYIKELSNGRIHNLIINGPAGVGKTHAVETFLGKYAQGRYKVVKGHMTPLSLYGNLFLHRDPNNILVLDDIDSVFKKIEGVNLLKAAMDTGSVRRINWESSNALKGVGIPDSFEFKGKVILISNIGFAVARKNSISAHLDALKDRSFNIVVADNTKESYFKQVCFMVLKKDMLHAFNLQYEQKIELLNYLKDHITVINKISLRTAMKLAQLIAISPSNWCDMADTGLLNELN
ncbi:MAG: ATP-binding protein [Gammaproteobacteria bacterium]|nr:ATP-binding protein [Gammaproteobacteria bacterium]